MAHAHKIHKAGVRDTFAPRGEPYWGAPVANGLYLGYRRHKNGTGTWVARWRNEDGTHRVQALGRVSPKFDHGEAVKAAMDWAKQIESGVADSDVDTVADACREYVADLRLKGREETAREVHCRFVARVYGGDPGNPKARKAHPIASVKLSKLRTQHIEQWRADLRVPQRGSKPELSPATLNRVLTMLKAALNYAVDRSHVAADRAIEWERVHPLEAKGRRDLYLDLAQRRALLAQLSGGVRDLAEAVMLTGARAGELTSATRGKFDARTGVMTFTGKTGTRTVPLGPAALAMFARLSRDKLPGAPLFTRDDGRAWNRAGDWATPINEAAERAGLPAGTCLYTLRHSFITEAITGGLSPLEVARLVGTSLTMIDKHYGHLANEGARMRLAAVNFV